MGGEALPRLAQQAVLFRGEGHIAEAAQPAGVGRPAGERPRHGPVPALSVGEQPVEVEEPAALGHGGQPPRHGGAHRLPHGGVGRQGPGEQLRIAAPQVEAAGTLGERLVRQRGELRQLGPQRLQQLQAVGVVEAERLVPGHGDAGPPLHWGRQGGGRGVQRRGGGRQGQQAVYVHAFLRLGGQGGELLPQPRHLGGGDQPQVAALQGAAGQIGQIAVHGYAGLPLDGLLEPGVEHGGHPVENHAPDAAVRPEIPHSLHRGGGGEGPPPAVQHQHRRGAGGPGQVIGAGVGAQADAVIVAHDPLDEGQAAAPAVFLQQVAGGVPAQEEEIQVAAFGPDDLAVKHGVDIVRAALEGHRPGPPVDQGLEKGAGDGGLAAPAGGGAEEQTGRAHARPSPEKIQTGFWASIRW